MIEIENLCQSFGKKRALDGLNLKIGAGVVGLLGPNGAGKTTLIRSLLGLYPCKSGVIRLDGNDVTNTQKIASISGYLPQRFGGFRQLTVQEFLEYIASMKLVSPATMQEEITECLELTNLQERRDDTIRSLSGGMIRRLGIAQALLGKPRLVIFDEPTAGLDPEERVRFRNLIAQLPKNRTVLISTHIVDDVASICSQVAIIKNGQCIANTTCSEVIHMAEGHVFEVPVEQPLAPGMIVSGSNLSNNNSRVVSLDHIDGATPVQPTLEDGYLLCLHGLEMKSE